MCKPCIVGCTGLAIDVASHSARVGKTTINEGDWLSMDGEAGTIYLSRCNIAVDRPDAALAEIERWRSAEVVKKLARADGGR